MVFIATPDVMPQAVPQESIVLVAASNSANSVRRMIYGVCKLFYATEDDISASHDSSVNSLSATSYMIDFLQPKLQDVVKSSPYGAASYEALNWIDEWTDSLKVKVLRAPEHGKFVNINNDPNNEYLSDLGYVGKDHIDLLVDGKDDLGRPISLTLKYFINVLPKKKLNKIIDENKLDQSQEMLCGTTKANWRITENQTLNKQASTKSQSAGYGWYIDSPIFE